MAPSSMYPGGDPLHGLSPRSARADLELTTDTFQAGSAAGTLIAAVTGLDLGVNESVVSIVPNDGRLALDASKRALLVGLSASSAGAIALTLTTSLGRVYARTLTVTAASDTTPDAFSFAAINGAPANSVVTFKPQSPLTGYDAPIPATIPVNQRWSFDNGVNFLTGSVTVPIPSNLGNNWLIEQQTGPTGSQTIASVTVGSVTAYATINVPAAVVDTIQSVNGSNISFFGDTTAPSTMFQDRQGTTPIVPNGTPTQRTVRRINDANGSSIYAYVPDGEAAPVWSAFTVNGASKPGLTFAPGAAAWMKIAGLPTPAGGAIHLTMSVETYAYGVSTPTQQGGRWSSLVAAGTADGNADYSTPTGVVFFAFGDDSGTLNSGQYRNGTSISGPLINMPYNGASRISAEYSGTATSQYLNGAMAGTSAAYSGDLAATSDVGIMANPSGGSKAEGRVQAILFLYQPPTSAARAKNEAILSAMVGPPVQTIQFSDAKTTTTSATASGATILQVADASRFAVGQQIVVPTIVPASGSTVYGTKGPGGFFPNSTLATDAAVASAAFSELGTLIAAADTGNVYLAKINRVNFVASRSGDVLTVTSATQMDGNGNRQRVGVGGKLNSKKFDGSGTGAPFPESQILTQLSSTEPDNAMGYAGTYRTSDSATIASQDMNTYGGDGWLPYDPTDYYFNRITPLSLITTIKSISGSSIELNAPVQAAVPSGTTVYRDNAPVMNSLSGGAGTTFNFVADAQSAQYGPFYTSGMTSAIFQQTDWTINGAKSGTDALFDIRAIRGTQGDCFVFSQSVRPTVYGIKFTGTLTNDGGIGVGRGNRINFGSGFGFTGCTDTLVGECSATNVVDRAFAVQYQFKGTRGLVSLNGDGTGLGGLFRNNKVTVTVSQYRYFQWQNNIVNTTDPVEFYGLIFNATWSTPALEAFEAANARYIKCVLTNGQFSQNTSKNPLIEDCDFIHTANCRDLSSPRPQKLGAPIVGFNSNSGNLSTGNKGGGGIIRRCNIIQQGYSDTNGNLFQAFNADTYVDVLFEGTYNPLVKDDGLRRGLISGPWKAGPDVESAEGPGIRCSSVNLTIRNARVLPIDVGGQSHYQTNLRASFNNNGVTPFNLENCIGGPIHDSDVPNGSDPLLGMVDAPYTGSGNINNRTYAALQ